MRSAVGALVLAASAGATATNWKAGAKACAKYDGFKISVGVKGTKTCVAATDGPEKHMTQEIKKILFLKSDSAAYLADTTAATYTAINPMTGTDGNLISKKTPLVPSHSDVGTPATHTDSKIGGYFGAGVSGAAPAAYVFAGATSALVKSEFSVQNMIYQIASANSTTGIPLASALCGVPAATAGAACGAATKLNSMSFASSIFGHSGGTGYDAANANTTHIAVRTVLDLTAFGGAGALVAINGEKAVNVPAVKKTTSVAVNQLFIRGPGTSNQFKLWFGNAYPATPFHNFGASSGAGTAPVFAGNRAMKVYVSRVDDQNKKLYVDYIISAGANDMKKNTGFFNFLSVFTNDASIIALAAGATLPGAAATSASQPRAAGVAATLVGAFGAAVLAMLF